MSEARYHFLVAAILLFLFSGIYKGALPIDGTVLAGAAVCVALLSFTSRIRDMSLGWISFLLFALFFWMMLRLAPDFDPWGARKLAEIALLGVPALFAGAIIARDRRATEILMAWLSYLAIPATALLVWSIEDSRNFATLGYGTYQHTGLIMAASMIAAAASGRYVCFGVAALGVVVSGHLSGALFGGIAVAAVWYMQRDWRTTGKAIGVTLALVALQTVTIGTPVSAHRMLLKMDRVAGFELAVVEEMVASTPSGGGTGTGTGSEQALIDLPEGGDRMELFQVGFIRFLERPLTGWGYGNASYLFDRYPHNAVIELAAETGIVGLVLGLALFAAAGFAAFRSRSAFAVGLLLLFALTAMVSGYFGSRTLMFALGTASGAAWLRARSQGS